MSNVIPFDSARRSARTPRTRPAGDAPVLTVKETAHYLSLSLGTTYAYLADGTIPGQRVGRRWIIPRASLEAWLAGTAEDGR